jgi:predicted MFS family arabinose efflux permease
VGGHPAVLDVWDIVPPLAVTGLGLGLTVAPLTDFTQAGVPEESAGSASGLQSATIQVGNAVGVAVLGAIFFSLLGDHPDHLQFASAMRQTLYCSAGAFAAAATLVFAMAARPNGGTR